VGSSDFYIEEFVDRRFIVSLRGEWTFDNASAIEQSLKTLSAPASTDVEFRCAGLRRIDLTGAWLLYAKSLEMEAEGFKPEFSGFKDTHFKFLHQVIDQPHPEDPGIEDKEFTFLARPMAALGRTTTHAISDIGQMAAMGLDGLRRPSPVTFRETINQLYEVGLKAVPIIALMSFLIGVVLAYQASTLLTQLGAGAFTIDLVAISILREMGVMLTAIMVAGRSGSAFAASLGVMKLNEVNEEVDDMLIMGLPPNGTLVLPRVLGLVVALPLLAALSDLCGIAGTWFMSVTLLGLSSAQFFDRINDAVTLDTVMVGLSKAPFFALIIGAVGTLRGLQVKSSAEELGRQTTRAVVEAIFLVITADAAFSIIYTELGI